DGSGSAAGASLVRDASSGVGAGGVDVAPVSGVEGAGADVAPGGGSTVPSVPVPVQATSMTTRGAARRPARAGRPGLTARSVRRRCGPTRRGDAARGGAGPTRGAPSGRSAPTA